MSLEDKKLSGAKKVNDMVIHRKKPHPSIPGQTVSIPYRVTDQPLKLSHDEWYILTIIIYNMTFNVRLDFLFPRFLVFPPANLNLLLLQEASGGCVCGWSNVAVQRMARTDWRWLSCGDIHKK